MRFNQFEFAVTEAMRGLFRGKLMSALAILSIAVALVIFGFFVLLLFQLHNLNENIGSQLEITAYFKDKTTRVQIDSLLVEIKSLPAIKKVEFISKEDAWQMFQQDFKGISLNSYVQDNPLPDALRVKAMHLHQIPTIIRQVEKSNYIEDIQHGGELAEKLQKITRIINIVGLILISVLVFGTYVLVVNTIHLTVLARQNEINIMQLVGATNSMIKTPYILEGFFMSLIGASIAIAIIKVSFSILIYKVKTALPFFPLMLKSSEANIIYIGVFSLGLLLGILGGYFSVNRALRR